MEPSAPIALPNRTSDSRHPAQARLGGPRVASWAGNQECAGLRRASRMSCRDPMGATTSPAGPQNASRSAAGVVADQRSGGLVFQFVKDWMRTGRLAATMPNPSSAPSGSATAWLAFTDRRSILAAPCGPAESHALAERPSWLGSMRKPAGSSTGGPLGVGAPTSRDDRSVLRHSPARAVPGSTRARTSNAAARMVFQDAWRASPPCSNGSGRLSRKSILQK